MYKNKNTIKAHKEKINSIQAAVEDAFAKDLMGREAYNLICEAAVRKMRKNFWEDAPVPEEQCTPPSPLPEQVAYSPLDELEPECLYEAPSVEVCDDEVQSELCCLDKSTKAPTEQEKPTIEEVPEATADTKLSTKMRTLSKRKGVASGSCGASDVQGSTLFSTEARHYRQN